ncbi:MAG: peptidylprolyl isomerase [Bryobacterales bacterium]|jgi:peptidyl-prolyl cis-trans isomerase C|nr:peptidylprolyl isomerase [Bryobacterales bacterium]
MDRLHRLLLHCGIALCAICPSLIAQAPGGAPPASPQDVTVVAKVDGRDITVGELRTFLNTLPPQNRTAALQNPDDFLRQYALMHRLAKLAEEQGLDRETPYREQLESNRRMVLSTAGLNRMSQEVTVTDEETMAYYESNKADYTKVKVKVIYLPFLNTPPKEGEQRVSLTESEAAALATRLAKEIRAGADFVEMVKQHSKDEGSAKRDGDFGTFSPRDNIPADVKQVLFALQPGAVSDPVRQPNGFYLFRVEEKVAQPYVEVAGLINDRLHDQKFRKVMDEMRTSIDIQDLKPELLKP